jgi:hypothetical protein
MRLTAGVLEMSAAADVGFEIGYNQNFLPLEVI